MIVNIAVVGSVSELWN